MISLGVLIGWRRTADSKSTRLHEGEQIVEHIYANTHPLLIYGKHEARWVKHSLTL